MDAARFDALARALAGRLSRRVAVHGAATSALAAIVAATRHWPAGAQSPTPLPVCSDPSRPGVGCACTTGGRDLGMVAPLLAPTAAFALGLRRRRRKQRIRPR